MIPIERRQVTDDALEGRRVLQQRRDIVEQNPRLGKVRNLTDELFVIHVGAEYRGTGEGVSINCKAPRRSGRRFPCHRDVGHRRKPRPDAKTREQLFDFHARSFDLDLYPPVGKIAYPAGQL